MENLEICEGCGKRFHETSFVRDDGGNAVSLYACKTKGCPGNHPHPLPTTVNGGETE